MTYRFSRFLGISARVPLGSFHATQVGQTGAFLFQSPDFPPEYSHLGFAETYWANVPRELVDKGHTVEESKKWARTIVGRLHAQCPDQEQGLNDVEYEKVESVLQEMIETLGVLERLCFLADKAGVFKFDLKEILTNYLGDVQIVTEFETARLQILTQFFEVMKTLKEKYPNAEIYVVAHSEGTVVSFMGLLTALCRHTKDANDGWQWIENVRGWMTIGSPIDKHLILWPRLWDQFSRENCPTRYRPAAAIKWRNFYDFSDPIGFQLNSAREWLKGNNLDQAFEFEEGIHDKGFYRYSFPGKAHNDYWGDDQLFGHFIEQVVGETPAPRKGKPQSFAAPPGNRLWPRIASKVSPYCVVGTLMFLAVYVLYKAMGTAGLSPSIERAGTVFSNVAGLSSLLLGVTLMARVPRLSNKKFGIPLGALGFAVFAAIYYFLIAFHDPRNRYDEFAKNLTGGLGEQLHIPPLILLAILAVIAVYAPNQVLPKLGMYTLLVPGLVIVIAMVVDRVIEIGPRGNHESLWPVVVALAGFFYLWWLAALILDLVLVWHSYIHNSLAMDRLRTMTGWTEVYKPGRKKQGRSGAAPSQNALSPRA